MKKQSVLFVCMGNICRSPTAHGVFRHKVRRHAAQRGYDLSDLRARQISDTDFDRYSLILVMDWDYLALVQDICPLQHQKKVRKLTKFCVTLDSPVVPDPYCGGEQGFENVLDLVEDSCDGLIKHFKRN